MGHTETLYGTADCETVLDSFHDVVERAIDNGVTGVIEIFKFTRMKPDFRRRSQRMIESFIEDLDEEYGHPDQATDVSDEMYDLARSFAENIINNHYQSWQCEKTQNSGKLVDISKWVKENDPDGYKEWMEYATDGRA